MTEPDHTVSREVKRQTVILIFSALGAVITVYVMRHMSDPDIGRTLKMKAALEAMNLADKQVKWWQRVADRAAAIYDQGRP